MQRDRVPVNDNNPEQALLLSSGLVKAEDGQLKVANALYKKAFSLEKVEQMLPGITKPVTIISLADRRRYRSLKASKLYLKFAAAACGLAVVATSISSYVRESGGSAMATSSDNASALVIDTPTAASDLSLNTISGTATDVAIVDRDLFDSGAAYAMNQRWVLMMREFCAIPQASTYYSPAKNQVEQLSQQFSEDIQLARDIVQAEKGVSCSI